MLLNTSKRTARYSFRSLIYAFCLTCAFWAASQGQNPPIIIKAIKSLLHTILWKFTKCFVYFCGWAGLLLHFTSVLNDLLLSFSFLSHPAKSQLNILDLCLLQNFLDPLTCFLVLLFPREKLAWKKTSGATPAWAISAFARRCASFNSESSLVIRASAWHWWRAWSCRGTGRLKHADVRCFCCYLADATTDSYGVTGFLGHSSSLMY